MSAKKERPLLKLVTLLGTVAVLGLFLGYVAERLVAAQHDEEEIDLPVADPMIYAPEPNRTSEWEQTVIKRATAGLPQYPGAQAHALGADYHGPEAPIAVAWFNTTQTPAQVLSWYAAQFIDAGIPPIMNNEYENAGYVAYMVPSSGDMRVVTALEQAGKTVVFISNGNLAPLLMKQHAVPKEIPLPEGVEEPMVLSLNQEGTSDVSVMAFVEGGDLEAVVSFYKTGYEARGWVVSEVLRPNPSEAHLRSSRDGRHAFTTLRRASADSKIEILVRVTGRA